MIRLFDAGPLCNTSQATKLIQKAMEAGLAGVHCLPTHVNNNVSGTNAWIHARNGEAVEKASKLSCKGIILQCPANDLLLQWATMERRDVMTCEIALDVAAQIQTPVSVWLTGALGSSVTEVDASDLVDKTADLLNCGIDSVIWDESQGRISPRQVENCLKTAAAAGIDIAKISFAVHESNHAAKQIIHKLLSLSSLNLIVSSSKTPALISCRDALCCIADFYGESCPNEIIDALEIYS